MVLPRIAGSALYRACHRRTPTITDDGGLIVPGLHLIGGEKAAHERLNAKRRQKADGGFDSIDALRPIAFCDVEPRPPVVADLLEDSRLSRDRADVGRGDARLH